MNKQAGWNFVTTNGDYSETTAVLKDENLEISLLCLPTYIKRYFAE